MPLIALIYAPQDEGLAAAIAGKLQAAGADVLSEPEPDAALSQARRADGVAARVKSADIAAILGAEGRESRMLARYALRAAFFYDRRVAAARLDPQIDYDVWAREPGMRMATPFAENEDGAAAKVFDVADLRAAPVKSDADDAAGDAAAAPAKSSGPPTLSEAAIEAYVAGVMAGAEAGKRERPARPAPFDEEAADALGFPRSPEAMLARWRLIEPWEDLAALESFAADYADDPYFSARAGEEIRRLKRRRAEARGLAGFRLAMGALLAGALFWMLTQACRDGACAPENAQAALGGFSAGGLTGFSSDRGAQAPEPDATRRVLEAAERDRARLGRELEALRRERESLRAQLRASADQNAEAEAAEATLAERDRLLTEMAEAAETERATFQRQLAALTEERDLYRARAVSVAGAEDARAAERLAALEREAAATRERLEARLQALGRERDRLRESLRRAETERDRYEAAARDRAAERDAFAAELGAGAGAAAATRIAQLEGALMEAQGAIAALREELAQRDALVAALRAELEAAQPQARMAAAVALPTDGTQRDAAAAVIVLRAMKEALDEAHARRRAAAAPGARVKGPFLSQAGVRAVQACLRDEGVAALALDGLWGAQTTEALLDVGPRRANRVAACLRRDLRAL